MRNQSDQPLVANPETSFHAYIVFKERQRLRRSGVIIVICSLTLLLGTGVTLLDTFSTHHTSPFPTQVMVWAILGAGVLSLVVGIMEIRAGFRRITEEEVGRIRQQARAELLRHAHGHIPWSYRRITRAVEVAFACFWLFLSASFFVLPIIVPLWLNRILSVFSLLGAIWFLLDALIWRPRRAKRLATESADELAHRLRVGEATEGQQTVGQE